jgi:hypothetical protein
LTAAHIFEGSVMPNSPDHEVVNWFSVLKKDKLHPQSMRYAVLEWRKSSVVDMYDRLHEELVELDDEINAKNPDPAKIMGECVDLSNAAMMIADLCDQRLTKLRASPE